jgi:lipoprotein NlpD
MKMRVALCAAALALAGCASIMPAPVGDSRAPTRVEPERPGAGAPAGGTHTVKKGDTLFSIALDNGLDHRELAAWNNIDDPGRIRVGQQLRLAPPGAESAAAPATEVRPIGGMDGVVARPLENDGAVSPAPTFADGNTERVKRAPKGGKLPYSEENLALLKARESGPAPVPAAPAVPTVVPAPETGKPAAATADASSVAESAGIEWSWPASGQILANFNDGGPGRELNKGVDIAGAPGDPVLAAAAGKVIYVGVFPKHGNLAVILHAGGYSSVYAHNKRVLVKEGQTVTRGQRIAELGDSDADRPKLHFEVRRQGKPVDPLRFLPRR